MADTLAAERWARIEQLFVEALELDAAGRDAFVRDATEDVDLREQLLRLLRQHERADPFLDPLDAEAVSALVRAVEADVPETIGPYRVIRPLGRGGMGVVYLARDDRLGRLVALKCLPPRLESDRAARDRLAAEARAASALDHPHVATIYDVGDTPAGGFYIAMAYYDGETLAQRLGRGALDVADALAVSVQLAHALDAAHAAGIVHRDIKPANVQITRAGVVKVLDFGIATFAAASAADPHGRAGTTAYMSPEQTRGEPVDMRTDYGRSAFCSTNWCPAAIHSPALMTRARSARSATTIRFLSTTSAPG